MKTIKFVCCLFVLSVAFETFAQEAEVVKLPEIEILASNYKYLSTVNNDIEAIPVKMLRSKVATFNIKDSDIYEEGNEEYIVSFTIPEGSILAAYDENGKVIRTVERFNNIRMLPAVAKSITATYPGWNVEKNIYRVTYHNTKGINTIYKFKLKKDGNVIRVQTDEKGNFI